jgi:hypothetical protein
MFHEHLIVMHPIWELRNRNMQILEIGAARGVSVSIMVPDIELWIDGIQ